MILQHTMQSDLVSSRGGIVWTFVVAAAGRYTATSSLDALLSALDSKSVSVSAYIRDTDSKSVDIDSLVVDRLTSSADLDALLRGMASVSADLSALLRDTDSASVNLDALIAEVRSVTVTISALLRQSDTGTIDLDALVMDTDTDTIDLDALLQDTDSGTLSLDIILVERDYSHPFYIEVRDPDDVLLGVIRDIMGGTLEQATNVPDVLSFDIPANEIRAEYLSRKNQIWVMDAYTDTVISICRIQMAEDSD